MNAVKVFAPLMWWSRSVKVLHINAVKSVRSCSKALVRVLNDCYYFFQPPGVAVLVVFKASNCFQHKKKESPKSSYSLTCPTSPVLKYALTLEVYWLRVVLMNCWMFSENETEKTNNKKIYLKVKGSGTLCHFLIYKCLTVKSLIFLERTNKENFKNSPCSQLPHHMTVMFYRVFVEFVNQTTKFPNSNTKTQNSLQTVMQLWFKESV